MSVFGIKMLDIVGQAAMKLASKLGKSAGIGRYSWRPEVVGPRQVADC